MATQPASALDREGAPFRLAVLIVNYRTPDLTADCVASFIDDLTPGLDCAVIVDNASGDGSADVLEACIEERKWSDRVRLIRSPRNGGFSFGHNLAIQSVEARAYVLLNSDAIVQPGALQSLQGAGETHPEAGIIGPGLEGPGGDVQVSAFRHHNPVDELLRAASTGPLTRLLRRFAAVLPVPQEPATVDWLSFACVWMRRELIEEIGLLDDGYFMYFEDADYCRRAQRAQWTSLYWPDARVVHYQGGSTATPTAEESHEALPSYFYASRARYFTKAYGRFGLLLANCLWQCGDAISWMRGALGGRRHSSIPGHRRGIWRHTEDREDGPDFRLTSE